MSAKVPTFSQIAWISLVPQFTVMGTLMVLWYQLGQRNFIVLGALCYLLLSQVLRRTLTREHRRGIIKVKQERFKEAIPHFQHSYDFFSSKSWIDTFRFFTVLSSSRMSYREMALNNMAFCYGQMGEGKLAKEYYQRTLEEFPNNGMAKAALRLINSVDANS